ncbi:hypothetical protein GQ457_09G025480 [Hibiscus cannabinus]
MHLLPKASMVWIWKQLIKVWDRNATLLNFESLSTTKIWFEVRATAEQVPWHWIIWFSFHIPWHNMLAWMTVLGMLPTRDRLLSWELEIDATCDMRRSEAETRDRLFFWMQKCEGSMEGYFEALLDPSTILFVIREVVHTRLSGKAILGSDSINLLVKIEEHWMLFGLSSCIMGNSRVRKVIVETGD